MEGKLRARWTPGTGIARSQFASRAELKSDRKAGSLRPAAPFHCFDFFFSWDCDEHWTPRMEGLMVDFAAGAAQDLQGVQGDHFTRFSRLLEGKGRRGLLWMLAVPPALRAFGIWIHGV